MLTLTAITDVLLLKTLCKRDAYIFSRDPDGSLFLCYNKYIMLKSLVLSENLLLHHRINGCSYNLDRSKLSYTLNENMFHNDGVGLSANQIGIWERAFVMMTDIDLQETITCFNPRILKQSRKKVIMQEGCLSYPDLFLDIERPESVVVKYEDEGKEIHKVKFEGFIARIFQHEYDHMEGIDFTQRTK